MIKKLLNTFRLNKPNQTEPKTPAFSMVENGSSEADFEITELTHEEYVKFVSDLRVMFRKQ